MNQLSPLVSLVSPLVAGPASSILVRETPAEFSQEQEAQEEEEQEREQEQQEEQEEEVQEVKKDWLSPPSVASSLVCLEAHRRRRRSSLVDQKFKSM